MQFRRSIFLAIANNFEHTMEAFERARPQQADYDGEDGHVSVDIEQSTYAGTIKDPTLVITTTNFYDDGAHHREVVLEFLEPEIGNERMYVLVHYTGGEHNKTWMRYLLNFNHPAYHRDDEQSCALKIGGALALHVAVPFMHHGAIPPYQVLQDLLNNI